MSTISSAQTNGERKTRKGPAKTSNANIRDIAAAAGVSVATVSRVMRGTAKVSDATREKVEKTIADLNYVPNANALALTTPPNAVTLVMRIITGGTYADMIAGVEQETTGRRMAFRLIATGWQPFEPHEVLDDLLSQRLRVAIMTVDADPNAIDDDMLNAYAPQFTQVGTNLVALARPRLGLGESIGVVDYDNEGGMYELTKYMISLGHREFLFAGRRERSSVFELRYQGFLRALREFGVPHDPRFDTVMGSDRLENVANIMTSRQSGARFTAIVAITDAVALDAIIAMRKLGLRVPTDVSVGGFDDMPYAGDLIVPLTTVHAPFGEMGQMAVRMGLDGCRDIMMPTHLVIRESVMPPAR